jgi:hypothetical protein
MKVRQIEESVTVSGQSPVVDVASTTIFDDGSRRK